MRRTKLAKNQRILHFPHHHCLSTQRRLYSVVVTSGLDLDDTGRALGRQLKISNNNSGSVPYKINLYVQKVSANTTYTVFMCQDIKCPVRCKRMYLGFHT